jgi:hypothetical protein
LEAVKALAAFGANGYGKEAAAAILEVVKQYDWTSIEVYSPLGRLKYEMTCAFSGQSDGGAAIAAGESLPLLTAAFRSGDERMTAFITFVFNQVVPSAVYTNRDVIPQLLELSQDEAFRSVRLPIIRVLLHFQQQASDERIEKRMAEVVGNYPPIEFPRLPDSFRGGGRGRRGSGLDFSKPQLPESVAFQPELVIAMKSKDPAVRSNASMILQALGPKAKPALSDVLPMILDDVDLDKQIITFEVLRTIRAIAGPDADKTIRDYLAQFIVKDEPVEDVARARLLLRGLLSEDSTPQHPEGGTSGIEAGETK